MHDYKTEICRILISTPINYTCTNLAEHLDEVSHDVVSNYLKRERLTAKPYQIRQFLKLVERYNLELEED